MSNGKENSGSPQFTSKAREVGSSGQDSPNITYAKGIPSVGGDSSGKIASKCAVPPVSGGRTGSPNNGANPQHSVGGEMRTPITG